MTITHNMLMLNLLRRRQLWRMESWRRRAPRRAARVEPDEALSALRALLADTQHAEHACNDRYCPVALARAVIAKAEGRKP